MSEVFQLLIEAIKAANGYQVIWALALVIVLRLPAIFDFIERLLNRQYSWIIDALKLEQIDSPTKSQLVEKLNQIIYQRATGILANHELRGRIDYLLQVSAGDLTREQFRLAAGAVRLYGGRVVVQVARAAKIESYAFLVLAVLLTFMALAALVVPIVFSSGVTAMQFHLLSAVSLCLIGSACLFLRQSRPYMAAMRLKDDLEKVEMRIALDSTQQRIETSVENRRVLSAVDTELTPPTASTTPPNPLP